MLEKTTRINRLYDFYYPLLTEKQRKYMQLYYHDDLSLSEIAQESSVSRQAVYEHLKRAEQLLEQYEDRLHLMDSYDRQHDLLNQLSALLDEGNPMDREQAKQLIERLKNVD